MSEVLAREQVHCQVSEDLLGYHTPAVVRSPLLTELYENFISCFSKNTQSEILGGLSIIMSGFRGDFVAFSVVMVALYFTT